MTTSRTVRLRRIGERRTFPWLRLRPEYELEVDEASIAIYRGKTVVPSAVLVTEGGVHSTDSYDWVRAADDAYERHEWNWVSDPFGPSQVSERYRVAMSQIAALIRERGKVPAQLVNQVDALIALWEAPAPDLDMIVSANRALWRFLEAKHGNSTTIADHEDRTVSAAICLGMLPGQEDAADLLEWAQEML
ncbi:hypothetical protein [Arthrobacter sp. NEB 688]|uniref:hypothetical protein n=1 Tax=Arthrobacter sp. NEB 688 TaxID=904039 RepID=UPI00156374F7|nr:hypothetical protein [Arthrobacter sp. NEB 688]QKE85143.1 hypothetical protein HL663_15160 [Arthrobacter sp. NEB 688]